MKVRVELKDGMALLGHHTSVQKGHPLQSSNETISILFSHSTVTSILSTLISILFFHSIFTSILFFHSSILLQSGVR